MHYALVWTFAVLNCARASTLNGSRVYRIFQIRFSGSGSVPRGTFTSSSPVCVGLLRLHTKRQSTIRLLADWFLYPYPAALLSCLCCAVRWLSWSCVGGFGRTSPSVHFDGAAWDCIGGCQISGRTSPTAARLFSRQAGIGQSVRVSASGVACLCRGLLCAVASA